MTGSAYLGALLPVTSSWAVAPMAGQFALRGQSGAPRRLSAPVFLNGGGGRGSERSAPCLGWVQCSLARTDMFQPCCHAGCHSLPGRESARSCRAPAMQYPFHLRGRRSTITSPRGGIVMTSLVLSPGSPRARSAVPVPSGCLRPRRGQRPTPLGSWRTSGSA